MNPRDDQPLPSDVLSVVPADAASLLELSVALAREAGAAAVALRPNAVMSATTKSSPTDPVTEADAAAEKIIVEGILSVRPDDGIVGEEGTSRAGQSNVKWFIDPIDGTVNYLYGIPAFSVSVAAEIDGRMSVGVVYNPLTGDLYTATLAGGSFRNGEPILVRSGAALETALIGTGFGYQSEDRAAQAQILTSVLPRIRDIRRFGSAALDLCSVAAGQLDGYYEAGLNVWDYAAGKLIVEESGGACRLVEATEDRPEWLFAGSPPIIDQLGQIVVATT